MKFKTFQVNMATVHWSIRLGPMFDVFAAGDEFDKVRILLFVISFYNMTKKSNILCLLMNVFITKTECENIKYLQKLCFLQRV